MTVSLTTSALSRSEGRENKDTREQYDGPSSDTNVQILLIQIRPYKVIRIRESILEHQEKAVPD